jgi:hypothetical protein
MRERRAALTKRWWWLVVPLLPDAGGEELEEKGRVEEDRLQPLERDLLEASLGASNVLEHEEHELVQLHAHRRTPVSLVLALRWRFVDPGSPTPPPPPPPPRTRGERLSFFFFFFLAR